LQTITRSIFKIEDDNVLNFLNEDGEDVEPEWCYELCDSAFLATFPLL
jgi:hypothetical protein